MKIITIAIMTISSLAFFSCGKMHDLLDTPEKLDKMLATTNNMAGTTKLMKEGMDSTNESIRMQKISIALTELLKKENREYISPLPGKMLPPGKVMAESLTAEEVLLFTKDFVKKVNEEQITDRHPGINLESDDGKKLLLEFEKEKTADLSMLKIISGYLPEPILNQIIDQESEQGAYREELFQILMLRAQFYDKLMLGASIMQYDLDTLGRIEKAIEYNTKLQKIEKMPFRDSITLVVTGYKNAADNELNSEVLDLKAAQKNWKSIKRKATKEFKVKSYAVGEQNAVATQKQTERFNELMQQVQKEIDGGATVATP